jgi:hypothetical protein
LRRRCRLRLLRLVAAHAVDRVHGPVVDLRDVLERATEVLGGGATLPPTATAVHGHGCIGTWYAAVVFERSGRPGSGGGGQSGKVSWAGERVLGSPWSTCVWSEQRRASECPTAGRAFDARSGDRLSPSSRQESISARVRMKRDRDARAWDSSTLYYYYYYYYYLYRYYACVRTEVCVEVDVSRTRMRSVYII